MNPLVSIVIPHLGRPQKLQRCIDAIQVNSNYTPFEIIIVPDGFPPHNRGVALTLAKGVEVSRGEIVGYLGNDCLPQRNWLRNAMTQMANTFPQMDGLVSLNDLHWYGTLATHWIASKKLLPLLDGYFFSPEYFHVGTDNELTARCQMAGKYTHAPDAIVIHQTPVQGDPGAEWDDVYRLAWRPDRVEQDRALLARRAKELGFEAWIK